MLSRGRAVLQCPSWLWLGAVLMDESARDDGDVDSFSQAPYNRDVGGRDKPAEGRRRGANGCESSMRPLAFPLRPVHRANEFAVMSMLLPVRDDLQLYLDAIRSWLEDMARPDGMRANGPGGPESGAVPSVGRLDRPSDSWYRRQKKRRGEARGGSK